MSADRRGPLDHDLIGRVAALRRHLIVSSCAAAVAALLIVAQAEVVARTLVSVIDGRSSSLVGPVAFLVAIGAGRALATATIEWSGASAMRCVRDELRASVLDHAAADAARERPGVAAREAAVATSGLDALDPYVRDYLPALVMSVAVPIAAIARIASLDWISAAIVVVTVPLIPVFMVLIGQLTARRSQRQWAVLQRLAGHFLDVLEGLPTLRLFGRARAQAASVRKVSDEYRSATLSTLRIAFLSALALELLATLSVAVVAVSIGLRLAGGGVGLEPALVVLLLAPECYLPLRRVGAAFHAAEAGNDAADDLRSVLAGPAFPSGGQTPRSSAAITVRGLRAPGRPVLEDGLDLDLAPGTVTVLRGPSGSGKSTVVDAVRGRLPDRVGEVRVDGVDVAAFDADAWADRVVVVPQRPAPLATTVAEEVRGGTAVDAMVIDTALAGLGLAGLADRGPATLSGGQLRRVQVARAAVAVVHGAATICLADEPTAQLDAESAGLVRGILVGLARDHDAIVVVATHDPDWSLVADRTVDVAGGRSPEVSPRDAVDRQLPVSPTPSTVRPATGPTGGSLADAVAVDDTLSSIGGRRWEHVRNAVRPLRRRLALAAGLATLAEVCTLGLAGAAAWLIVRASEQPPLAALAIAVTGIRAFGIGKGVFRYVERLASHDVGFRLLGSVRADLVDRLADVAPVPGWQRGDLLRRAVDDVDRLLDLVVRIVVPWAAYAVVSFGAVVVVVALDPGAGVVVVATVALVGIIVPGLVARHERAVGTRLTSARASLTDRVLDVTEHVDLLVGAGLLRRARGRVEAATDEVERLERSRAVERTAARSLVAAVPALAVGAVLAVVGVDPGVSAPVYGVLVLWPLAIVELLAGVSDGARTVPELAASATRVDQLLALRRDDVDAPGLGAGPRPVTVLHGVVARWPGSVATLGPYDLMVAAGGRATLTGPSGSGKSTLAASMVRYCPVVDGTYQLDGRDALAADPDDVRRTVLWVDQHPWIGDSTLRENLKIGDPTATDDELAAALAAVELDGWLARLPNGLDTRVGRRGHAMSGGEAHRVGLARALLAGHPVVVLDEPVSHLDAAMGERVMRGLDGELRGRSMLVLGHRAGSRDAPGSVSPLRSGDGRTAGSPRRF